MGAPTHGIEVGGDDGDTHELRGVGVIRVDVGEEGEIDGGGVVDLLEGSRSVEVTDSRLFGRRYGRSLGLLHCRAEGTRLRQLVGIETGEELGGGSVHPSSLESQMMRLQETRKSFQADAET